MAAIPTRVMRAPRLNHEALEREIALLASNAETADIATRSQVRLEHNEAERDRLEAERMDINAEIEHVKRSEAKLRELREKLEANLADVSIDLTGIHAAISALREAGISSHKAVAADTAQQAAGTQER